MGHLIEQYPIIATLVGFVLAVTAGAIDLVVLKNRALAILFWVVAFPLTVTPSFSKESWGDSRWFIGAGIGVLYVIAVVWVYRVLAPGPAEDPVAEDGS